ncbi:MAG TPA: hypothetical protein VKO43_03840 [Candidatus Krumholzibacteriaceae bacterium]|nr:hypothetical protein [Candidatus Krumholzibacteriaceae bacterium]
MYLKTPIKRIVLIALTAVSLLFGILTGNENFMLELPVYDDLKCEICHETSNPVTGDAELNPFGTDFHANGDTWDETLANMDSDGDGHKNGIEIGDEDGDGVTPNTEIRSNPGDSLDKPSSITKETWGVIKSLYKER